MNASLASTDTRIGDLENNVEANREAASSGIAQALASMHAITAQPEAGTRQVGVGIGSHDSKTALAIGLTGTSESGNSGYSISVSGARNAKPGFGAGARWKF